MGYNLRTVLENCRLLVRAGFREHVSVNYSFNVIDERPETIRQTLAYHRELERIFEKFYRGRAASSICAGTGLGLALSRDLVTVHGGEIWAENRSPKGARFVVRLPREARRKGKSDA